MSLLTVYLTVRGLRTETLRDVEFTPVGWGIVCEIVLHAGYDLTFVQADWANWKILRFLKEINPHETAKLGISNTLLKSE